MALFKRKNYKLITNKGENCEGCCFKRTNPTESSCKVVSDDEFDCCPENDGSKPDEVLNWVFKKNS